MVHSPKCDDKHDTERLKMARWCEHKHPGEHWPVEDPPICNRMIALARARQIAAWAWPWHPRMWWRFRRIYRQMGGRPCLTPVTPQDIEAAKQAIDEAARWIRVA